VRLTVPEPVSITPRRALDGSWIGVNIRGGIVCTGPFVIVGGEKVGVRELVVVGESCDSIEVAVGLFLRAVIVTELHAFAKNNNKVIKKMDNDVSFFTSISMSRFSWFKPVGLFTLVLHLVRHDRDRTVSQPVQPFLVRWKNPGGYGRQLMPC